MFRKNVSLSSHSNYLIGGTAKFFYEAKTIPDLKESLLSALKDKQNIFLLGGGTNILFSDSGFDGLVIKPALSYIKKISNTKLKIGAGTPVSELLSYTINHELSGLEWAGGLPGTLGGAIRGNAGCFGGEIKDIVKSVSALKYSLNRFLKIDNKAMAVENFSNKECGFGYRDSLFKKNSDYIILEAELLLKKGEKTKIKKAIQEKIDYRNNRHPMEYPSIGSIFKNVPVDLIQKSVASKLKDVIKTDPFPVVPAAYLVSESGLKGVSYGGAMISPKHPNFIVNVQGASATDVQSLIWLAKNKVKEKFGIDLEEEVIILS